MNAITSVLKCKPPNFLVYGKRSVSHWYKDWKPGQYPTTPAERAAAAKKYNLLPEEYEPDPDGFGDYPKLPDISGASKDPYYNWDMPELKKDWGETMHRHHNIISEDRWDINDIDKQQVPYKTQIACFFGSVIGLYIVYLFFEDKKAHLPHMKKHLIIDGPHYKYP